MPVAMADSAPDFLQELIINIFSRLQAKSIGKCRCVSKPWRSLLSDPLFIKAHLNLHLHHPQKHILISISHSPSSYNLSVVTFTTTSGSSNNDGFLEKLTLLQNQLCFAEIVGSCNGLVLVLTFEGSNTPTMYLMNPTTRELVKFQPSPLVWDDAETSYGFGYDSSSDDYKIVTLSHDWLLDKTESYPAFVDVFSWQTGTWRRIGCFPYVPSSHSGVFLNGSIHWLALSKIDGLCVIIALDMSCKQFQQLPWPETDNTPHNGSRKLVLLGGCLGMVVVQSRQHVDVWMMKEYGVGESWTKFIVTTPKNASVWGPICLLGGDDVVLQMGGKNFVVVHYLKERTMRDMVIAGIRDKFRRGVIGFSESLVSPIFNSQQWRATLPEDDFQNSC
ncbi:F-box/kelch-repeat protein At3g06240-like [Coffea arabica]|uniref:F-box/kelch-repeat protein At3g06240-like n=1 Tax=Coffea arabica TaxID=13443 RepID=A0ABM4U4B5_COFAR